ncbi:uncharacterized protein PV09_07077 [Verruconis gallopava]|uniref:DSBA-like thioredoxin domain-containing protein n=1 Tax=Verruconis gallopava TaxID=253628 RepID=A0A0D2A534_9PEZI|nr:uncharacterized protein PV09_07077 [Verruconis gallopava]KIW01605.1 hypothetical protein PV09_07077 [Verruconis gallopava]
MTSFNISIISDTVCPWCYIGYRRLQKAIEVYQKTYPGGSNDTFNVEWKPYYLNPEAPTEGVPIQEKMVSQMGAASAERVQAHMASLASAEGIILKYGGKTGNTRLSHHLLHFAKSKGQVMQNDVALELFRLQFKEERDITDIQTLLDAARNCGLDVEEAKAYLASSSDHKEVDMEAAAIRESGVQGVPVFLFEGGEHIVDGSGDVMEFFEIFMKIKGDQGCS